MRWHITLGAWFKDYIFYPLSMSGPLKKLTGAARRRLGSHFGPLLAGSVALLAVWLCNGLWHGAGWQYIFFGLYHFALILCGSLTAPLSQRIAGALHIDRDAGPWRMFRIARTALLVCVGELFFRADGLRAGLSMFRRMVTDFSLRSFTDGTFLGLGMDKHDFFIVIVAVLLVFAVGLMRGARYLPARDGRAAAYRGPLVGVLRRHPFCHHFRRLRRRLCAGRSDLRRVLRRCPHYENLYPAARQGHMLPCAARRAAAGSLLPVHAEKQPQGVRHGA